MNWDDFMLGYYVGLVVGLVAAYFMTRKSNG